MALAAGGRGQKGGLSEYAARVGKQQQYLSQLIAAARVAEKLTSQLVGLESKTQHLSAIHALPQEAWQPAVDAMMAGEFFSDPPVEALSKLTKAA